MVLRVLGLTAEKTYGVTTGASDTPDFHRRMNDGSFKLGDEPVTYSDGSRMVQGARPGAIKPSGSSAGKCDLKRIGHFLYAFFDQYKCTEGGENEPNVHEFWGGEQTLLHSLHGWATFDEFEKVLCGLLLDSLKLEVSSDFMSQSEEWIYKDETSNLINQSTYTVREVEGAVPLMFYDIGLELGDGEVELGIQTQFSFEGKNNHNQDATIGLGSRKPQCQAEAQAREISMSITSYLTRETVQWIKAIEYGEINRNGPSECKILTLPLLVTISNCEDPDEVLTMLFPNCTVAVEYSLSESEQIETTFNLTALGTGEVELYSDDADLPKVKTDCYCKLITTQPNIEANFS